MRRNEDGSPAELYRYQRGRLKHAPGSSKSQAADAKLRAAVSALEAEAERQLADPSMREPCRKALLSLQEHWAGLAHFVDDLRIISAPAPRAGANEASRAAFQPLRQAP